MSYLTYETFEDWLNEARRRKAEGHALLSCDPGLIGFFDETDETQHNIALWRVKDAIGNNPDYEWLRTPGGRQTWFKSDPNPCEEIKVGMISMGCYVGEVTSFDPTTKRSCEHIRELKGVKDGALVPGRTAGTTSFLSASFVPAPRCERCSGETDNLRDDIWTCPKCGQETGHTGVFPVRDAKETP